mmetsp:Transcript_2061/g.3385  ORF Transcript_2061/g.3385 Transcript_2061/m.3385 type:complete len:200 (+) Transcript_2061:98-697(+)
MAALVRHDYSAERNAWTQLPAAMLGSEGALFCHAHLRKILPSRGSRLLAHKCPPVKSFRIDQCLLRFELRGFHDARILPTARGYTRRSPHQQALTRACRALRSAQESSCLRWRPVKASSRPQSLPQDHALWPSKWRAASLLVCPSPLIAQAWRIVPPHSCARPRFRGSLRRARPSLSEPYASGGVQREENPPHLPVLEA